MSVEIRQWAPAHYFYQVFFDLRVVGCVTRDSNNVSYWHPYARYGELTYDDQCLVAKLVGERCDLLNITRRLTS